MSAAEHPPVAFGEIPKPYRDASGVRWQWWNGQWRKAKTRAKRRAQKRYAASVAIAASPLRDTSEDAT